MQNNYDYLDHVYTWDQDETREIALATFYNFVKVKLNVAKCFLLKEKNCRHSCCLSEATKASFVALDYDFFLAIHVVILPIPNCPTS